MSHLLSILENKIEHPVCKWPHYLPLYEKHFRKYKKRASPTSKVVLLEIGVDRGGSLDMWSEYFGPENCLIYGFDVSPQCATLSRDNITVFIGDQGKEADLIQLKEKLPPLDILIDDGGHTMHQQILTFQILFDHVKPGGVYLCEDTHTSYWPNYGGGLRQNNTFQEFSKNITDLVNGYHWGHVTGLTKSCTGIHFYDSMVFFDKAKKPYELVQAQTWVPKK